MNTKEIIQGSTISWEVKLFNYLPSDGWLLKYYFRGVGTGLDVTATDESDVFKLTISAADTANFGVGEYAWQAIVEKDDEKHFIEGGTVKIKQGLASLNADTPFDTRSGNRIALDNINAMIQNKATVDQQEYTIGNRSLKRYAMVDLINLQKHYQQLVNQETIIAARKKGKSIFKTHRINVKEC